MKKEEPEPGGTFLCLACPASVYPSRDLLRLHLLGKFVKILIHGKLWITLGGTHDS